MKFKSSILITINALLLVVLALPTQMAALHPRGDFLGSLKDSAGKVIINAGLWALVFREDAVGDPNTLYFTAGSSGENHGLFGTISPSN